MQIILLENMNTEWLSVNCIFSAALVYVLINRFSALMTSLSHTQP